MLAMEPAAEIIKRLGGVSVVATITGVHRTRVSNWKRPRAVGGTGGRIPQSHHLAILRAAKDLGISDITAETLLPREPHESAAPADEASAA
jgi:hypothetical protein